MKTPSPELVDKLKTQQNIWFASVRPDGRPHLAPVWFVWHADCIYISTDPNSVKSANIQVNPRVTLALEDGTHPLICEGVAEPVAQPWSADLLAAFYDKYEWDVTKDSQYNHMVEVKPVKWLMW